jgi:dipeptidyl aminopeptidase/acylaminoacyl peptidase
VWTVPVTGGAPTRVSDSPEQDASPRWSPDGRTIAYVGVARRGERPRIRVAPSAGGGASRALGGEGFDWLPQELAWAEGGRALLFGAPVRGETHLFRLDVASGAVRAVTSGPRAVRRASLSARGDVLAYTSNDFTHLDEVHVARAGGQGERRVSGMNDSLLARVALQPVERFTYKAVDGLDVDGFVVRPLGWRPGTKYPVILNIHGGPAAMYGVDWYHEFQVYAARGWGVLFLNPRGSTGYGHAFQRAIAGEWGGKDYDDVMRGVDAALARHAWMDSTRLGVTGGSYGGYLTNWIVTRTDRFKAAVTLRSISNFVSDEGTRDFAYGHDDDFGGDLFERFDLYWERSPLKYVQRVRTPILVLHAENDLRVPLEQAEQWFRALRHFDRPSELVIFPRDNHDLTRTGEPRHLVESLDWQTYWFERFIDRRADAVRPVDR